MHLIIWEYQVKEECVAQFEKIYGGNGAWAELFGRSSNYLGTELLRHTSQPLHYITMDRWSSATDFDSFLSKWKKEYEALVTSCEDLIERETLVGKWGSIPFQTR